jgi:ribosomal protein S27E
MDECGVYVEVFCGRCGHIWFARYSEKVKCPKCGWIGGPQYMYREVNEG